MNVEEIARAIPREMARRHYIRRAELLDQTVSLLKVRLHITSELFIQIYRNDRFETTNLVLVHNGRRLYGRDQLGGLWHRHSADSPDSHDTSDEGRRVVSFADFLDEVEVVLAERNLP